MGPLAIEALRAERAEATYWATYARNIPTTDDTRDTGAVAVAGGYAICLQGTSLDYALGIGTSRSLREDDLQIVDEFYGSRNLQSRIELHPLIAERDTALITRWGYRIECEMAVLDREIGADAILPPGHNVETLTGRKLEWIDLIVAGFADAPALAARDLVRRTASVCANAASALIAIRIDGRLAGGGALGVTGDAAVLFCASTLPEFRRRGVYVSLIEARIAVARSRGATYAFMTAPPDSTAMQAALRAGFATAYVRRRLLKRDRKGLASS